MSSCRNNAHAVSFLLDVATKVGYQSTLDHNIVVQLRGNMLQLRVSYWGWPGLWTRPGIGLWDAQGC